MQKGPVIFGAIWTTEMRTELIANMLEQVHVAVFQDKYSFKGSRITLRVLLLHVTRPPSPFLFRACSYTYEDSRKHILLVVWDRLSARQGILVWEF